MSTRRASSSVLALLAALLVPTEVLALTQPDGTTIPVPVPGESLQGVMDGLGEMIDVQASAAVLPETFDPTCGLTFTLVSRGGAGFQNAFGWYNVTGSKPADSDLHELIPCTAKAVSSFPLMIKGDPAYKGGKIGFFLVTPEGTGQSCGNVADASKKGHVYYSERMFNPDNTGPNSYIHLLIYDSVKYPKAFYFCWEDLYTGGDNNFEDFVARVDGITCAGGGAACDTGKKGVCGAGTMQCHDGKLTCTETTPPATSEICDGLDNDCNGKVDDGAKCPPNQICDKGQCVPPCASGEFTCLGGLVCSPDGTCVDPKCATVTCPAGQLCKAGACVAPCDGVKCPNGQVCRIGACVDPCFGVACDKSQVCIDGTCGDACSCAGCAAGSTCDASGKCVTNDCAKLTCPAGQYCAMGACADACAGAACPGGAACVAGQCQPPTKGGGGAGGGAGAGGKGGASVGLGGASVGLGGASAGKGGKSGTGGASGGTGGSLVTNDAPPDPGFGDSKGGCGCRTTSGEIGVTHVAGAVVALAAALRRRRRRTTVR